MNDAIPRPQAKTRKALTPLLEIRNLTKSYDGQHAVDDVSLTIYKYSAAIFLIPVCISFDTAEKRRYATYLILNRRFSFKF
ncbi:hypothetical protein SIZ30_000444 [Escherichia coli]|nr:hypothetical protein [Escherichia coli]